MTKILIKRLSKKFIYLNTKRRIIRYGLAANIEFDNKYCSRKKIIIPTGITVSVPKGFEIQIRPRSGLAAKQKITVLNTPGTIDADYRGEIKSNIN